MPAAGPSPRDTRLSRRDFVRRSATAAAALGLAGCATPAPAPTRSAARGSRLRVGVVGCGGRGTGAAANVLQASPDTEIVALGDLFPDRLDGCTRHLAQLPPDQAARCRVDPSRCFTGFDAGRQVLASGVDLVILATPPGFRPIHFEQAVQAGVHVFMEKPVAVDPAGVRRVLAAADAADERRLCVVAGTQRRHERSYRETIARVRAGAIGRITGGSCYWNQGGLWKVDRAEAMSDAEWQIRNWLYFTWLSGDHIVEQHVHNIDAMNWAIGAHPVRASGMGGRQVRTSPAYGHVFDHFAVEFEYPGGVVVHSYCRQIDGCASRVEECLRGTEGSCTTRPGFGRIEGRAPWAFPGPNNDPYVQEQADLLDAITSGQSLNEARQVAESTLTAIMGRMAAYTGKVVTWEQALASTLDLSPPHYALGPLPTPEVAVPGRTPLV
jgi:predicted dehydrogenase